MTNYNFGAAETRSPIRDDLARKLILVDGDGNKLDLSASFEYSDVLISETRTVNQPTVPFRSVHPRATGFGNPTQATFDLQVLSLRKVEIERQIEQIRTFWDESATKVVDIYWIFDENADPYSTGDSGNYYSYLPECSLLGLRPSRGYGRFSGGSVIQLDVSSPYTKTVKTFTGDVATSPRTIRGQKIHLAQTDNGSIVLAVVRESDGQGLLTLDDQGSLKALKEIKTHQSLPVISI